MQYTARINWKYGVNLKNIARDMTPDEIKDALVRDPANRKYSARIQSLDTKYIRKAVALAKGWHRQNRRRSAPVAHQKVEQTTTSKVTFNIGGCKITVPRGVNVEVSL